MSDQVPRPRELDERPPDRYNLIDGLMILGAAVVLGFLIWKLAVVQ